MFNLDFLFFKERLLKVSGCILRVVLDFFTRKFFKLSGRASRIEFLIISILDISEILDIPIRFLISLLSKDSNHFWVVLILFIPLTCSAVRRLHDIEFSSYWVFIYLLFLASYNLFSFEHFHDTLNVFLTPLVVLVFNIPFIIIPETKGKNKYGDPPEF